MHGSAATCGELKRCLIITTGCKRVMCVFQENLLAVMAQTAYTAYPAVKYADGSSM